MAQLKDTIVSGSLRATDTIYTTTLQAQIINAPTTSNGTTYGPGTNGHILKSNGSNIYWSSLDTSGTWSGNAGTATKFASAQVVTLTGDTTGTASSQAGWSIATTNAYMTGRGRPTSANITNTSYLSKFFTFLASSSMTTGKPRDDGTIAYFGWDNNGWAGELYIPNAKNGQLQFRGAANSDGASDWENWVTVLDNRNYTTTLNNTYLQLAGGTLTGVLTTPGIKTTSDISLYTSSADSPDITWYYANQAQEQARIWMGSGGTAKFAPLYRCYSSDGTSLYSGHLVIGDGTGASGTWGIDISGLAAKATADGSGNNIVDTYLTKAAGVTNVAYDTTNKKITKTINGTTSDVVSAATLKTAMALNNVTNDAQIPKSIGQAKGDIIYFTANATPVRLANTSSTTKNFLSITSQVPAWTTLSKSDVGLGNVTNDAQVKASLGTTKGDLLYWSASATPARLGIGTNGYFLTVSSGAPAWSALPTASTGTAGIMKVGTGLSVSSGTVSVSYGTSASTAVQGNATLVTLNGTNKTAASIASFYAPTSAGTSGQYLKSSGSGAPTWANLPTLSATSSGSGNVVTAISASNYSITYTLGTISTVSAQIIRW